MLKTAFVDSLVVWNGLSPRRRFGAQCTPFRRPPPGYIGQRGRSLRRTGEEEERVAHTRWPRLAATRERGSPSPFRPSPIIASRMMIESAE